MDHLIRVKSLIFQSIVNGIVRELSDLFVESALSSILEREGTSAVSHVPKEILTDIFKRLPVKSLLRFRCVSKPCCSMINDQSFISMQTKHTINDTTDNNGILLIRSIDIDLHMNRHTMYLNNESFVEYRSIHSPLEIQGRDDYLESAGSCNGLLCLYNPNRDVCWYGEDFESDPSGIMLWNPAIRKSVTLPTASLTGKHKAVLGFGFDSKTNDYKVVRLAYQQDSDDSMSVSVIPQVELFKLSMNAWRRINSNAPSCQIFVPSSHAFLHGAVHWVGFGYNADEEWVASVVLFDLENELFRQMKLPDESDTYLRDEFLTTLMVSNQSLCFIDYKTCIHYNMYNIWVMKEYGMAESWTKQFSVHANVNAFPKVLGFRRNGQVLLEEDRGEVVSHNPKTGITVPLGIHGVSEYFYVNSYVESLALLDQKDAVSDEVGDDFQQMG